MRRLNRRNFLKNTAKLGLGALAASMLPATQTGALASIAGSGKTLVVLYLPGGIDGINFSVPYGDPNYYTLRPTLAIPEQDVLKLSGSNVVGLNPALKNLHALYNKGELALMPACHVSDPNRSHFYSQKRLFTGLSEETRQGWIDKYLEKNPGERIFRTVAISNTRPFIAKGIENVSVIPAINSNSIPSLSDRSRSILTNAFNKLPSLRNFSTSVKSSGLAAFNEAAKIKELVDEGDYNAENGAQYNTSDIFGRQMRDIARLIKKTQPEIVYLQMPHGWDTHQNQVGGYTAGLTRLDTQLAAFVQDLGDRMEDVTLLCMSEFGRTAKENNNNGTDHGHATTWFALGKNVNGGIHGEYPGLAPEQLDHGRYLSATVNSSDVVVEVLTKHLGYADAATMFPKHDYQEVGIIKNA